MKDCITFVETKVFSRRIAELISDDELAAFQMELAKNPEKGPVIEGTGGLRKIRWAIEGKGKRGGLRIIYLHLKMRSVLHLVFVFAKNDSDDLTVDQKKQLRAIVDAIKREYTQ